MAGDVAAVVLVVVAVAAWPSASDAGGDRATLTGRRSGRSAEVQVTDPFGAPFTASIEKVG